MSPSLAFIVLSCFIGIYSEPPTFEQTTCPPLPVSCQCGETINAYVHVLIDQSWFLFSRWSYCAPRISASFHCQKFRNCDRCHRTGALECLSCPPGKFGTWCDSECDCRNGATCDRTGKCLCPKGLTGPKCENQKPPRSKKCDCRKGVTCDRTGKCLCPKGLTGSRCERKKQQSKTKCGRSYSPRTPLIRNGNVTSVGQWPWQAALYSYDSNKKEWELRCGGALLDSLWIVTAAHCVTKANSAAVDSSGDIRVFLGKYHRSLLENDGYVQEPQIDALYVHREYDPHTLEMDIALIKLKQQVTFNQRVQPICLPTWNISQTNVVDRKKGLVTGWGMNENNVLTETLQQARLPVVTWKNCKQAYSDAKVHDFSVTGKMFCAGHSEGFAPDTCRGDSGGPMIFTNPFSKKQQWVLEGIVSWGSPDSPGCGVAGQFAGFTRVSKFLKWIQSYISQLQ